MGNQRNRGNTPGIFLPNLFSLICLKWGEMSSISLAAESETEHVAEWIVLAGSAACVVEFKMDCPLSGLSWRDPLDF